MLPGALPDFDRPVSSIGRQMGKRVGVLGAFALDNPGDNILGLAVHTTISQMLPDAEVRLFSPELHYSVWDADSSSHRGIGIEVEPIPTRDHFAWAHGLDSLIIGGGGLIYLDPDYRVFWPRRNDGLESPAAWNGLCCQGQAWYMPEAEKMCGAIRECCEGLSYVSVRNGMTLKFLRKCNYDGPVQVIPDPSLLLPAPDAGKAREILDETSVDQNKFIIGLSAGSSVLDPRCRSFYGDLFAALRHLIRSADKPTEVVTFPFGSHYNDEIFQRAAARELPGARHVTRKLSPLDYWALIGCLDLYLGARLHAILAALAQGVPFLALDEYLSTGIPSSKIREFIVDCDLEECYLCPFISQMPGAKLQLLINNGPRIRSSLQSVLARIRSALHRHYRAMLASLKLIS